MHQTFSQRSVAVTSEAETRKQQTQWPYFFLLPQEILQGHFFNFKHVWLPFKSPRTKQTCLEMTYGLYRKANWGWGWSRSVIIQWFCFRTVHVVATNTVQNFVTTLKCINFFWRSPGNFNLHQHSVEFDWMHDLWHQQKKIWNVIIHSSVLKAYLF